MYYKYFIEFLGTLTLLFSNVATNANPAIMAITYFAMATISEGISQGFFTPLAPLIQYFLGRMTMMDCFYYITAQYVAAICIILSFISVKTFIERAI